MATPANLNPILEWRIPRTSQDPLHVSLNRGEGLFVVDPNGSEKSALIQQLISKHQGQKIRRISAHRRTSLSSGSLNLTPLSRKRFEQEITSYERAYEALWREEYAEQKQSAILFDLVA